MTARLEDKPGPFPFRQLKDCFEVLVIADGEVETAIKCRTKEDATAVSNWRVFQHRHEYPQAYEEACDLDALKRTLAVLPEYGINSNVFRYRQCVRLAERLQGAAT